jgi:outer membrane protein OmpA-like peptidoglycan-associated protein
MLRPAYLFSSSLATLHSKVNRLASFLKIYFCIILFCNFFCNVNAQNYFANPDFEEYNLCIEYRQLCSAAAWFYIQPAATPLINLKTVPSPLSGRDLLIVPIGNVNAKITKHAFVYSMFCCPLQKGKNYKLAFYLHTGGKKFYGLDFYFRKKEFLSNNFFADSVQPSMHISEEDIVTAVNGWNYVETMYTAKGDERYSLIGNLSKTPFDFKGVSRMNKAGDMFCFIDNISFTPQMPEKKCSNYDKNVEKMYGQHLRHTERTEVDEEPDIPKFIIDTITIPAVFFETDKAILKATFKKLIYDLLVKYKTKNVVKIDIEGHTDNTGSSERNVILSKNRAEAVLNYFVLKAPYVKENIFALGKAADFPIADNNTALGRAKNRRVQIILTYSNKIE